MTDNSIVRIFGVLWICHREEEETLEREEALKNVCPHLLVPKADLEDEIFLVGQV